MLRRDRHQRGSMSMVSYFWELGTYFMGTGGLCQALSSHCPLLYSIDLLCTEAQSPSVRNGWSYGNCLLCLRCFELLKCFRPAEGFCAGSILLFLWRRMLIAASHCLNDVNHCQPLCNWAARLQSGLNNGCCCLEIKCCGIEVSHSGGSSDPSDLLMSHRWTRLILLSCPGGAPRPLLCEETDSWKSSGLCTSHYPQTKSCASGVPASSQGIHACASQRSKVIQWGPETVTDSLVLQRWRIWFGGLEMTLSHNFYSFSF